MKSVCFYCVFKNNYDDYYFARWQAYNLHKGKPLQFRYSYLETVKVWI